MTVNEFVTAVRSNLPSIAESESSIVNRGIERLHASGFSLTDAVAYTRCIEDVTPFLEESLALARMKTVLSKYPESQ